MHNITHYIHVISECSPSHAVSNLCDRFRWTLVKGALRGESSLGVTQADSTTSPAGRKEPCSTQSCCLSSLPTRIAKIQACKLYNRLHWIAFTKRWSKTQRMGKHPSSNLKKRDKHKTETIWPIMLMVLRGLIIGSWDNTWDKCIRGCLICRAHVFLYSWCNVSPYWWLQQEERWKLQFL